MKKRVKISELKAHLSEYLRHVRRGHTVEVLDRETPVARIIPSEALQIQRATASMKDFVFPPPLDTTIDVVALLREDRDAR
jgi:prevent-host-death family protein